MSQRIRGARSPGHGGLIIGRKQGAGTGDLQQLNLNDLQNIGLATNQSIIKTTPKGFGFFIGGTSSGEFLGAAVWGRDLVFTGTAQDEAYAQFGSITDAVYMFAMREISGAYNQVGTLTFNKTNHGVIAWNPGFIYKAGAALEVTLPSDTTLANVRVMLYAN